ncbi:hypothetical protein C8R47DRAFT_1064052 [Mycena vitilis]|nr:hypothetical protein C8R47DRAFT_1064052 [Mycena vitilis]
MSTKSFTTTTPAPDSDHIYLYDYFAVSRSEFRILFTRYEPGDLQEGLPLTGMIVKPGVKGGSLVLPLSKSDGKTSLSVQIAQFDHNNFPTNWEIGSDVRAAKNILIDWESITGTRSHTMQFTAEAMHEPGKAEHRWKVTMAGTARKYEVTIGSNGIKSIIDESSNAEPLIKAIQGHDYGVWTWFPVRKDAQLSDLAVIALARHVNMVLPERFQLPVGIQAWAARTCRKVEDPCDNCLHFTLEHSGTQKALLKKGKGTACEKCLHFAEAHGRLPESGWEIGLRFNSSSALADIIVFFAVGYPNFGVRRMYFTGMAHNWNYHLTSKYLG